MLDVVSSHAGLQWRWSSIRILRVWRWSSYMLLFSYCTGQDCYFKLLGCKEVGFFSHTYLVCRKVVFLDTVCFSTVLCKDSIWRSFLHCSSNVDFFSWVLNIDHIDPIVLYIPFVKEMLMRVYKYQYFLVKCHKDKSSSKINISICCTLCTVLQSWPSPCVRTRSEGSHPAESRPQSHACPFYLSVHKPTSRRPSSLVVLPSRVSVSHM